jgi:two-component system, cell cycle response regulator DivK
MRKDSVERKSKILIVEDNSHLRELFALLLQRSGFDVVEAATGFEAINQTRTTHPDLILMDLGLPDMTGAEAMSVLNADLFTREIPVIVNTAFLRGPMVDQAIAAGAAEILYKPTGLKTLLDAVRQHLEARAGVTMTRNNAGAIRFL